MLKFICKKITLQWFLLIGLFAIAIYIIFTKAHVPNLNGNAFLFESFTHFFLKHGLFGKIIISLILLFQIVLLQIYFSRNEYSAKTNLLPSCLYISILLATKSFIYISPFFFTLFFFTIVFTINYTGKEVSLKNNVFWVGMLIALATCFDISSIVLLLLATITIFINQFSRMKEIGIMLFGFSLVYLYFFSFYFFNNNHEIWFQTFQQIKVFGISDSEKLSDTFTIIKLNILAVIYLYLIVRTKLINDSKVIIQRKRIITLNTRAILMTACLLLTNSTYPHILGYLYIYVATYLALLAQEKSPLYFNEFVTIATFVLLCL